MCSVMHAPFIYWTLCNPKFHTTSATASTVHSHWR
jgi:hypothetical protein